MEKRLEYNFGWKKARELPYFLKNRDDDLSRQVLFYL